MDISDADRPALYARLTEALGEQEAVALMQHLPPSGWEAVERLLGLLATTEGTDRGFTEVDRRFTEVYRRFDAVDRRFDGLEERIDLRVSESANALRADFRGDMLAQTRLMIFSMLGALATMAGIAFAAGRLVAP